MVVEWSENDGEGEVRVTTGVERNGQGAGQSLAGLGRYYAQPCGEGEKSLFPPPLRGRARVGGQDRSGREKSLDSRLSLSPTFVIGELREW